MADDYTTLQQLRTMRDTGVRSLTRDGITTTFRSQAELNEAILRMERRMGLRKPRIRSASVYMGHR